MISCNTNRKDILFPLIEYQREMDLSARRFWLPADIEVLGQADALDKIERFVERAIRSSGPAWEVRRSRSGEAAIAETSIGRRLREILPYLTLFDSRHDYSEHAYAFLDACWLIENVWGVNLFSASLLPPALAARHAEALNDVVEKIRMSSGFDWFARGRHDRSYEASLRTMRIARYTAELLQSRSRLMLVRDDFSYAKQYSADLTIDQVYADIDTFIKLMRRHATFRNLLGYAIAIEQGSDKGFHFHCLFFFDGSKERLDIAKGAAVGRVWRWEVTRGRGIYFNSNARKHEMEEVGIGMILRSDPDACANAVKFARYLTKDPHTPGEKDPQFLHMKPADRNMFWIGQGPDLESTVGRPPIMPIPWSVDQLCGGGN